MAWTCELQALASRNPFIEKIVKQGYDVGFINAHLVIFGVPYLNASGELKHLDMISPLDLREEYLIDRPSDHKVYFAGEIPCNIDGQKIGTGTAEEVRRVSDQIVGNRMLSSKPEGMRPYDSIEEKINQYLALISSPAVHKYPDVTPRRALKKHLDGTEPAYSGDCDRSFRHRDHGFRSIVTAVSLRFPVDCDRQFRCRDR